MRSPTHIPALTTALMGLLLLGGCATHPSVVFHNDSGGELCGFVQIPAVVVVGYPTTSVREWFSVPAGESKRFNYGSGNAGEVENWSTEIYVALLRPDGRWHLANLDARRTGSVELRANADPTGNLRVTDGPHHVDESDVGHDSLLELLGDWQRDSNR